MTNQAENSTVKTAPENPFRLVQGASKPLPEMIFLERPSLPERMPAANCREKGEAMRFVRIHRRALKSPEERGGFQIEFDLASPVEFIKTHIPIEETRAELVYTRERLKSNLLRRSASWAASFLISAFMVAGLLTTLYAYAVFSPVRPLPMAPQVAEPTLPKLPAMPAPENHTSAAEPEKPNAPEVSQAVQPSVAPKVTAYEEPVIPPPPPYKDFLKMEAEALRRQGIGVPAQAFSNAAPTSGIRPQRNENLIVSLLEKPAPNFIIEEVSPEHELESEPEEGILPHIPAPPTPRITPPKRHRLGSNGKVQFQLPLNKIEITSRFGLRWGRPHQGIDFGAPEGTPIVASAAGRVVYSGWQPGYGNVVVLDHGHGLQTRYGHCSRLFVSLGNRVDAGEKIGLVGTTGRSTGPHLHFEIIAAGVHQNPETFLFAARQTGSVKAAALLP